MGVDVRIMVNARARIRDVADVIGILAGKQPYKRDFDGFDGWSTEVDDVEYKPSKHMAECAEIMIRSSQEQPLVDGHKNHWVLWHWEPSEKYHCHVMQPPSTPFWIAVGKGLVDFFGGKLDYNDCDSKDIDYEARGRVRLGEYSEDGIGWEKLQNAKLNLKPITMADMKKMDKHAAYDLRECLEGVSA
jgi:hypothetical protein